MNRDPKTFLKRAEFFRKAYDLSDDEYEDEYEEFDENVEYEECIPLDEPVICNEIEKVIETPIKINPICKRFYDPLTRHYYNTSRILGQDSVNITLTCGHNSQPISKKINCNTWYPEVSKGYEVIRDPKTGKYYRVKKIYDNDGGYTYRYEGVVNIPKKRPGNSFYQISHYN
jgi:hypothetical protein